MLSSASKSMADESSPPYVSSTFDSPFYTPSLFVTNNSSIKNSYGLLDMETPQMVYRHPLYSMKDEFSNNSNNTTVQDLLNEIRTLNTHIEKQRVTIIDLHTTLANKDLGHREQTRQIAIYQSFLRSKGFDPSLILSCQRSQESSELNRLHDTLPEVEPSLSDTTDILERSSSSQECASERRSHAGKNDYNRMFEKNNNNINWSSLVHRIIKDTDQQASIFMQQKLKTSTPEQKNQIFKAILPQAYELMVNRFGNFLVQKLLELGTPYQVKLIVGKMKGKVLKLTCEPFGCHVIQRALDFVDEPCRASLVSELLVNIPETITHKHACHVWQKVFEMTWVNTPPPPIMTSIHRVLKGQWKILALDETGSLIIQNIFENMTEPGKRPILNEVLRDIISISKGQWGNWVVQHILEQAEKKRDREVAFKAILNESIPLSMDQFASKVVEKALRIGGPQFVTRYIHHVSGSSHQRRMALIDIASDQYGNYIIQWLINNVPEEQKVSICKDIKRHMVSLRGSKYGQRVAFLVEKVLRGQETTTYSSTACY